MDVAVDDGGAPDSAITLQVPHGDSDVVEHAEAFPVVRESVVQSTAEVNGDTVVQREPGGLDRSADHQPEAVRDFGGPGDLELCDLFGRQAPVARFLDVLQRVNQQQVIPTPPEGSTNWRWRSTEALSASRMSLYFEMGQTCGPMSSS